MRRHQQAQSIWATEGEAALRAESASFLGLIAEAFEVADGAAVYAVQAGQTTPGPLWSGEGRVLIYGFELTANW